MLPEARAYLHDIEQATALVDRFRRRKTFIGEAVSKLSRADPTTAARLTGRRRIIALRNIPDPWL
jgi:hypothetical protein